MGKTAESHAWRTWPNMRQFMPSVANQKHLDLLNNDIRNEYHLALKIYKNMLKRKKELFP
jgi:hypothetical protein